MALIGCPCWWGFPGSAHGRPRAPSARAAAHWREEPEPLFLPRSPAPLGSSTLKLASARPACWGGHRAAEGVRPRRASAERAGARGDRAAAAVVQG